MYCAYELMCVQQGIEEDHCSLVQLYNILPILCARSKGALILVEIRNVHVCPAQSEVFRMSYLRISTPGMFTTSIIHP